MIALDGFSDHERIIKTACETALNKWYDAVRAKKLGRGEESGLFIKVKKTDPDNPEDKRIILHMGLPAIHEKDAGMLNNRIGGIIMGELMQGSRALGGPEPEYDVKEFEMSFSSVVHLANILQGLGYELDLSRHLSRADIECMGLIAGKGVRQK